MFFFCFSLFGCRQINSRISLSHIALHEGVYTPVDCDRIIVHFIFFLQVAQFMNLPEQMLNNFLQKLDDDERSERHRIIVRYFERIFKNKQKEVKEGQYIQLLPFLSRDCKDILYMKNLVKIYYLKTSNLYFVSNKINVVNVFVSSSVQS